jgi:hypothetical protein
MYEELQHKDMTNYDLGIFLSIHCTSKLCILERRKEKYATINLWNK